MAVLVLEELERLPERRQLVGRLLAVGHDDRVEEHRRHGLERHVGLEGVAVDGLDRAQARADAAGRRRPASVSASRAVADRAPIDARRRRGSRSCGRGCCRRRAARSATAPATARPPASAARSSARHRLGQRDAEARRPPRCASSSATLRSIATMRSRIAGTWTLVSSKRKARTMCAFSTASGCSRTASPACSGRRTSPACRAPCRRRSARGKRGEARAPAWNGQPPPSEFGS